MERLRLMLHVAAISAICIIVSTYTLYNPSILPFSEWKPAIEPFPKDTIDNLFWFVQVSDLHVSRYHDPQRVPDFKDFCNSTLGTINPDLVLVTGDLTDAKSRNTYDSQQFEDEWQTYQKALEETKVTEKYTWLDIRGNHDAFDVLHTDDPNSNFYLKYSGDKGKLSSQVYHLKKPFGTYSFIPVDATMVPGPRRPYNFVGYLDTKRMEKLEEFQKQTLKSNFTIWYSHYPTPSITSHNPGLRGLIGQSGGVYVAGHLHTLGGLSKTLYVMNPKGFLELELGDWKYERMYRIMALDHDMLSFSDMTYKQWPAIVLTNPKAAQFMMPHVEPIRRIIKSTHIRFLVFDPWEIEKVEIRIDDVLINHKPYQVQKSPLWVCRWDTRQYITGMHDITITVTDSEGNKKTISQQFSLDTSWSLDFGHFAPFVLLTDFSTSLMIGFYLSSFGYICAIIFLRFYRHDVSSKTMFTKASILLKDTSIFNGFLIFALNLMWGPWFVGELLRGTIGICFPFGMLVKGEIMPEHMLYFNGIQKVALFYLPALLFLAHFNYAHDKKSENNLRKHFKFPPHHLLLAYMVFIAMKLYSLWGVYASYGLMAAIISPFELWWTCFILYQTWRVYHRKPKPAKS